MNNNLPFVSVVIAVFNAEKTIKRCLDALLNLDYPNYGIIVVDNNSNDKTKELVKKYEVIYLFEEKRGWPAARNRGIKYSKARFIANIDSDCFADKEWLKILINGLINSPDIGGVVGRTKVEKGKTLLEQYYAESDPFNIERHIGNNPYVPWGGGNNAYKKEVFEKVGYYDSDKFTSGADIEFHERVKNKTDFQIKYIPEAVIYHVARTSIKEIFLVAAKYSYDGYMRTKTYPELKGRYSGFMFKKLKEIIKNIAGFLYRGVKFTFGRETKLRTVSPIFATISYLGNLYGYCQANIHLLYKHNEQKIDFNVPINKINIAIINRLFWKDGAIPLTARNLVSNLSKKGIKTIVFSSDVNEKDSNNNVTFVKIFTKKVSSFDISGWIFTFCLFFKLISAHRKQGISILQVHDSTAFYGAWLFSRLYKIPNIMFMHACIFEKGKEGMYPKSQALMYKINTKFYIRHADHIACVSRRLTEWAKQLGAKQDSIKLIQEPVDTALFRPLGNRNNGYKTILFVGRASSPEKGIRYLLEALRSVVNLLSELKLIVIGEISRERELVYMVEKLGIEENVEFKGTVPYDRLSEHYSQASILVIPSISESGPKVLLEALSCGTPVIGTKVGRIPEVITDGYNGFLVNPCNSNEIADAIIKVFSNGSLLKTLSGNARQSVQHFSWDNAVDELIAMYGELARL